MKRKTFQVTFSGRLVGDLDKKNILKNLSILFRKDPDRVRKAFNAPGAIIAECASREEADRYTRAIRRAGAVCEIREQDEPPAELIPPFPASYGSESETPRTIDPIGGGLDLALAPLTCSRVGGTTEGLTTNRIGRAIIPYGRLTIISIFKSPDYRNEIMVLLFNHGATRPLIMEASAISFSDFPKTAGINLASSLRNFLSLLVHKNPALVIDRETADFLAGASPPLFSSDPIALASDLNRAYIRLASHVQ